MFRRRTFCYVFCLVLAGFFAAQQSPACAQTMLEIFGKHDAAFVVVDENGGEVAVINGGMAEEAFPPYSTFKIWNSLIALETGVMKDTHERLDYDPQKYPLPYMGYPDIPAWKQPHDMASAFKASAVWYYREIAGRIGSARMQEWLDRIAFGNRDISGGVKDGRLDDFWNGSSLRISAFQQIDLLAKLFRGELPFSKEHIDMLREMAVIERCGDRTLSGKTGAGTFNNGWLGWLVGWVEQGEQRRMFALLMREESLEKLAKARLDLTKQALSALGLWQACS